MPPATGSHPWYALRVRSRFEFTTAKALREKGYSEFVPFYRSKRHWSDRVTEIRTPLFPGYVFCRFDASQPFLVLNSPGVAHVVAAGKRPLEVNEEEVSRVWSICHSGAGVDPWPFLEAGRRVLLERGPLAGIEGIVVDAKPSCRIVVSVSMLQRSVSVEIEREWIKPL